MTPRQTVSRIHLEHSEHTKHERYDADARHGSPGHLRRSDGSSVHTLSIGVRVIPPSATFLSV